MSYKIEGQLAEWSVASEEGRAYIFRFVGTANAWRMNVSPPAGRLAKMVGGMFIINGTTSPPANVAVGWAATKDTTTTSIAVSKMKSGQADWPGTYGRSAAEMPAMNNVWNGPYFQPFNNQGSKIYYTWGMAGVDGVASSTGTIHKAPMLVVTVDSDYSVGWSTPSWTSFEAAILFVILV